MVSAALPSIPFQPQGREVILHEPAAFGVIAHGTAPLSYQWRKDGVPIIGATDDQIVLAHAQFSDAGLYSVVISNPEGSVTSVDAALTVKAQKGGDLDYSFAWGGSINGPVRSIAVQPDGKVLMAGEFTTTHGAIRRGIARLNADGTTDHTFMNALFGVAGADLPTVYAIALQSDGKALIGGNFTSVNGVGRTNIARLNADGSLDAGFQNGLLGTDGAVYSVAVQSDGKVLVGGLFSRVNRVNRGGIARLETDGRLDSSFQDRQSGTEGGVYSLAVQPEGKVLVGGGFTSVNGVSRGNIARLNADGTLDSGFQNGLSGADSIVFSISLQNDGKVLLGGGFRMVNGVSRGNIARLNADGSLDNFFQDGLAGAERDGVFSVLGQSDGRVLIGGLFATVNGVGRNHIARLNADGTLDGSFQNELAGTDGSVASIAVQSDAKVLLGGTFASVNGVIRRNMARLNADGTLDSGFENGVAGPDGTVSAIARQSDGKLLVGGRFGSVHGVSRGGIARLNANGTLDSGFDQGISGPNSSVYSVAAQSDGKVLLGGIFTAVNGVGRSNIARLNADGTLDETFQSGLAGANGGVYSVAVQGDGKVIIGGIFTMVNDASRSSIARLNADGTLDASFQNELPGADTGVASLAVQSDGRVILGGVFTRVNGVTRNHIARLEADGSLDLDFQNGLAGTDGRVTSVALQSDGKILIAGAFRMVNGLNRSCVARLNPDGTSDRTFLGAGFRAGDIVNSVAAQSDGKVVIGGLFTATVGVTTRSGISRLTSTGSIDNGFQRDLTGVGGASSPLSSVNSVAVQSDGRVFIGGRFTTVNGAPASGLARLWGSLDISPLITSVSRSGTAVTLTWEAVPGRTYRMQYQDALATSPWVNLGGPVLATSAIATRTDTTLGGFEHRFYRVVLQP